MKKSYVILVAPETPRLYLAAESDENDGEPATMPDRTADVEHALIFSDFVTAREAMRAAVKRYPSHQFRIDVINAIREAA